MNNKSSWSAYNLELNLSDTEHSLQVNKYHAMFDHLSAAQATNLAQREGELALYTHQSFFTEQVQPAAPPQTWSQLLTYVQALVGKTVEQIADKHQVELIDSLKLNRGWLGNLIEIALGASAGSKPTQDFIDLGLELKTLAINENGKVKSDIFISSLPLNSYMLQDWQLSHVLYKLKRILFIPVENNPEIPLAQRRIGKGFIWSPNAQQLATLEADWKSIMEIITQRDFTALKSNLGSALCVRVKALNTQQSNTFNDIDLHSINLPPLSFYLRRNFVNEILQSVYNS
ncbi:DNA mismatch repair protein MutH [Psittacicella hinzii]|uniref:DNA mismatch repair MutH/Type II restriction enzyme Sau3AI domain-containing protein n=1 Tax=Psittacicella hinzii TaxID=2028575 RepID=A0A3A1YS09_9GAMM|nr:DNA mismatch repair protein MutH [Psittacicella hinzii]RIY40301.1 hypothetical protein CKF58_00815 [Psittacicella hinzii]